MFKWLKHLQTAREGDRMMRLYERALNAANSYAPYLFGPGSGVFASAVLNEVLTENLFEGDSIEEFRANNPEEVCAAAKEMMETVPVMRELLVQTLWVKWITDRAYTRSAAVKILETSWAFTEYASDRGAPTMDEFEKQISLAEHETKRQRADWMAAIEKANRDQPNSS